MGNRPRRPDSFDCHGEDRILRRPPVCRCHCTVFIYRVLPCTSCSHAIQERRWKRNRTVLFVVLVPGDGWRPGHDLARWNRNWKGWNRKIHFGPGDHSRRRIVWGLFHCQKRWCVYLVDCPLVAPVFSTDPSNSSPRFPLSPELRDGAVYERQGGASSKAVCQRDEYTGKALLGAGLL